MSGPCWYEKFVDACKTCRIRLSVKAHISIYSSTANENLSTYFSVKCKCGKVVQYINTVRCFPESSGLTVMPWLRTCLACGP